MGSVMEAEEEGASSTRRSLLMVMDAPVFARMEANSPHGRGEAGGGRDCDAWGSATLRLDEHSSADCISQVDRECQCDDQQSQHDEVPQDVRCGVVVDERQNDEDDLQHHEYDQDDRKDIQLSSVQTECAHDTEDAADDGENVDNQTKSVVAIGTLRHGNDGERQQNDLQTQQQRHRAKAEERGGHSEQACSEGALGCSLLLTSVCA